MRRSLALLTSLSLAAALSLTGCSPESGAASADGPLRIGYQRFGGLSLVKAHGDAPGVQWSLFESGPALTEAIKAGAIDIGETGEAPPIFAAAAKTPLLVAGASAPAPRSEAVLVKASRGFKTFADLRGKTIALNKGSNVNWLLVRLLAANRMTLDDITVKYLKPAEGRPAFDTDQVDAWIIWDPYLALAEKPGVQVLADATGLANNRDYLLVSTDAAERRTREILEFRSVWEKTRAWGMAHPDERAAVVAPELKIDEPTAKRALSRAAQLAAPLTPEIGTELQAIADGFTSLKLIPTRVDVSTLIDPRFLAVPSASSPAASSSAASSPSASDPGAAPSASDPGASNGAVR